MVGAGGGVGGGALPNNMGDGRHGFAPYCVHMLNVISSIPASHAHTGASTHLHIIYPSALLIDIRRKYVPSWLNQLSIFLPGSMIPGENALLDFFVRYLPIFV